MTTGPSSDSKGPRGKGKGKAQLKVDKKQPSLNKFFTKSTLTSPGPVVASEGPTSPSTEVVCEGSSADPVAVGTTPLVSEKVQGGSEGHTKSRGKPLANKRDRAKDGKDEEEGGKKKSPKRAEVGEKKAETEEEDDDEVVVVERASSAQAIEVEGEEEEEGGDKEHKEEEEAVAMDEDKEGEEDKEGDKEEGAVPMDVEEADKEEKGEGGAEEAEKGKEEATPAVAKTPTPKPAGAKGSAKRSRTSSAKKKAALACAPESELERKYREQLEALLATTPIVTGETQADFRLGVDEALAQVLQSEGEKKKAEEGEGDEKEEAGKEGEKEEEGEKEKEEEDKMEQDGEEAAAKPDEATDEPTTEAAASTTTEAESAAAAPVPVLGAGEVPEALVPLLARLIQGSHLPLTQLAEGVLSFLSERLVPCVEGLSLQGVMDKIRLLAERKCYGQKPRAALVPEDTCPEALWVWELAELAHLPEACRNAVREVRGERNNVGRLIKALIKLIETIRKDPADAASISQVETKMFDAVRTVEVSKKKRAERLKKEEEKAKRDEEKRSKEEEKAEKARLKEEAKAQREAKKEDKEKRKRESTGGAEGAEGAEGEAAAPAAKKKAPKEEKAPPKPAGVSLFKFFTKKAEPAAASTPAAVPSTDEGATTAEKTAGAPMEKADSRKAEAMAEMDRQLKLGLSHDEVLGLLRDHAQETKASGAARNPRRKPHRFTSLTVTVTKRAGDGIWDGPDYAELEEKRLWDCMKFFKFAEDVRPPYYGTWSKRSLAVSGRKPFGQDRRVVDYDYDSEEDWEEGDNDEEGENLSVTAVDDERDPDDGLDYNDGWLARDNDLGLSDDEDREEGGQTGAEDGEVVRFGTLFFDADFNADRPIVDDRIRSVWEPFRVMVGEEVGPVQLCWNEAEDAAAATVSPAAASTTTAAANAPVEEGAVGTEGGGAAGGAAGGGKKGAGGRGAKKVPPELMPALITLVNKSKLSLEKLTETFLASHPGPSKAQVYNRIKEVTSKSKTLTGGACLLVHKAVMLEFGMARDEEEETPAAVAAEAAAKPSSPLAEKGKGKEKATAPAKGQKAIGAFLKRKAEAIEAQGGAGAAVAANAEEGQANRAYRGDDSSGWEETKVSEK